MKNASGSFELNIDKVTGNPISNIHCVPTILTVVFTLYMDYTEGLCHEQSDLAMKIL